MQIEKDIVWAQTIFEGLVWKVYQSYAKQSQGYHTLFVRHSVLGGVTALLVYVGDWR